MVSGPWSMKGFILSLLSLSWTANAFPLSSENSAITTKHLLENRSLGNGVFFRILCAGASITQGYGSDPMNGYRRRLREQLIGGGNGVNYVGPKRDGDFADNNHAGFFGYKIAEIEEALTQTAALVTLPNLVLINAGTNNCADEEDPAAMKEDMKHMVDKIFSQVPSVTILLSSLIPNAAHDACTVAYNSQLAGLVGDYQSSGKKILYVDMHGADGPQLSDLIDGIHPNNFGYEKMAAMWYNGITQTHFNGWLTEPDPNGLPDAGEGTQCDKTPDRVNGPYQIQVGALQIWDDGKYIHKSNAKGVILSPDLPLHEDVNGDWYAEGMRWADIDGNGVDDFVWVGEDHILVIALSLGGGKFMDAKSHIFDHHCLRKGVQFGDINGDGRADFICVGPEGNMYGWINQLQADAWNPKWKELGLLMEIPMKEYSQPNVRIADIDGDGRCDYAIITNSGDIYAWRNGGQKDAPLEAYGGYWQDMGLIFGGKAKGDINGVRFADLNADGRDDWLYIYDDGKIDTWINQRAHDVGLLPYWLDAGTTHGGMGVKGARNRVFLGKFWGSGRADYAFGPGGNEVKAWENVGSGGTQRKGDGARYCDMRNSGSDDYVWLGPDGEMYVYGNKNDPPNWIFYDKVHTFGFPRKELHLGDFNADGLCDVMHVNKANGAVKLWTNHYADGKWSFTDEGLVSAGFCNQGYGPGLYDLGVRFADINGDGRVDYMCIEKDGRITGWLNRGINNWDELGQVKFSVGADRANLRFADIDGNRRADLLWLEKINGKVRTWYNNGQNPTLGSAWAWECRNPECVTHNGGMAQGANIHFGNIAGIGRDDFIEVIPSNAAANVWYNGCPGNEEGDDTPPVTPPPEETKPHWLDVDKEKSSKGPILCEIPLQACKYPIFDHDDFQEMCERLFADGCDDKDNLIWSEDKLGSAYFVHWEQTGCYNSRPWSVEECTNVLGLSYLVGYTDPSVCSYNSFIKTSFGETAGILYSAGICIDNKPDK